MSKLSFNTFCIEHYSYYINRPSNEVYNIIKNSGLLNLLETDYEDLHGMSMEYLMQFFSGNMEISDILEMTTNRYKIVNT